MFAEIVTIKFRNVRNSNLGHQKQASKVTREDGKAITFMDKMSKKEAIRQALNANEDAWK